MAMSIDETKNTARQQTTTRRTSSKGVVPAPNRAATARKLEPQPEKTQAELERQEKLQTIAQLEEKRDKLVDRLDEGAARIEEERSKGKDVTAWEDYWITLLRQYETTCEKLRDLHVEV